MSIVVRSSAVIAVLTAALAGCATAYESGVQDRGGGVFFVAVRTPGNAGGGDESARKAKEQANAHCAKSGKVARIANQEVGPYQADVIFTCADK
jgi:hypothetical protein